jgi:hypothetical protein
VWSSDEILTGKTEELGEKPVPIYFTRNSTWTALGANPAVHREKLAA